MKKNENKNKKGIIIGISALALALIVGGYTLKINKINNDLKVNNEGVKEIEDDTNNKETVGFDDTILIDITSSTEITKLQESETKENKNTTNIKKDEEINTTKKQETTQVVTEKQTEATTQETTKAPVKETTTQATTKKPETTQTTTKEPTTESTTKAPSNNENSGDLTDDEFEQILKDMGWNGQDSGSQMNEANFELTGKQVGQ